MSQPGGSDCPLNYPQRNETFRATRVAITREWRIVPDDAALFTLDSFTQTSLFPPMPPTLPSIIISSFFLVFFYSFFSCSAG